MSRNNDEFGILVIWFFLVLGCVGINVAFLYMLWRLGWAAIAWLGAH